MTMHPVPQTLEVDPSEVHIGKSNSHTGVELPACFKGIDSRSVFDEIAQAIRTRGLDGTAYTYRALSLPAQDHVTVVQLESGEPVESQVRERVKRAVLFAEKMWLHHLIASLLKLFRSGEDELPIRVGVPSPVEWHAFRDMHGEFAKYLRTLETRVEKIVALQLGVIRYGQQLLQEAEELLRQGTLFVGVHNHDMMRDVTTVGKNEVGREMTIPLYSKGLHANGSEGRILFDGKPAFPHQHVALEADLHSSVLAANRMKPGGILLGAPFQIEREGLIGSIKRTRGFDKPDWVQDPKERGSLGVRIETLAGERKGSLSTLVTRLAPSGDFVALYKVNGNQDSPTEDGLVLERLVSDAAELANEVWRHDLYVDVLHGLQRGKSGMSPGGVVDSGAMHNLIFENSTLADALLDIGLSRNQRIMIVRRAILACARELIGVRDDLKARGVVAVHRRNGDKATMQFLGRPEPITARYIPTTPFDEEMSTRHGEAASAQASILAALETE